MKPWISSFGVLILAASLALHQGCSGNDESFFNPLVFENVGEPYGDLTQQAETLPQEAFQPQALRIGEKITVFGQGRTLPQGYYLFLFSGNASQEIYVERATDRVQVAIPDGAITGPFGFQVSERSILHDQGKGPGISTGPSYAYRFGHPGVRITGPQVSPGGLANQGGLPVADANPFQSPNLPSVGW